MTSIAFCSKCNHYELYGKIRVFGTAPGRDKFNNVPMPEFCAKCGAKMLNACPNCGATRRSMSDKCCTKCGKPYK